MLALLTVASGAQASSVLDFTIPGGQGGASVSYAGGSSPLVGSNLKVSDVSGGGTPANSGATLAITNGLLNFTTGSFTNSNGGVWNFGGGGSVTITGTVAPQTPAGFAPFGGTSGTLMDATFSSASVSSVNVNNSFLTLGLFFDPPNSDLKTYFGLPDLKYQGFFNLTFNLDTATSAGSPFDSSFVGSGDTQTSPVPAPGFLVLLCSGSTVSFAGYALRRWKTAKANVNVA
jgi:hypothetical protein